MKILANHIAHAIRNAPAPERNGQRHNVTVQAAPGEFIPAGRHPKHTVYDERQFVLIAEEFVRDGRRWYEWTVEL